MTLKLILMALMMVESTMGRHMVNRRNPQCVGWLSMKPCVVRDVNRIIGEKRYTLADRYDYDKSIEIATVYVYHYCPEGCTWRDVARLWHYGPVGRRWKHKDEAEYLSKIQKVLGKELAK